MHLARLAALIALAGCADEIALEDYPAAVERSICDWEVKCNRFASMEDCAYYRGQVGLDAAYQSWYVRLVEGGYARYDGAAAADCLAAYAEWSCDTRASAPSGIERCNDVFFGLGKLGTTCRTSLQCITGYCDFDYSTCGEGCCMGTCQPVPRHGGVGEACGHCADGLYCADDDTCQPRPGIGDPCDHEIDCADDLYCPGLYDRDVPKVCAPLPGRGEPCISLCADARDTCNSMKVCGESAVRGEACTYHSDCAGVYECTFDNVCDYNVLVTQRLPAGSPCIHDSGCVSSSCEGGICAARERCL